MGGVWASSIQLAVLGAGIGILNPFHLAVLGALVWSAYFFAVSATSSLSLSLIFISHTKKFQMIGP